MAGQHHPVDRCLYLQLIHLNLQDAYLSFSLCDHCFSLLQVSLSLIESDLSPGNGRSRLGLIQLSMPYRKLSQSDLEGFFAGERRGPAIEGSFVAFPCDNQAGAGLSHFGGGIAGEQAIVFSLRGIQLGFSGI